MMTMARATMRPMIMLKKAPITARITHTPITARTITKPKKQFSFRTAQLVP